MTGIYKPRVEVMTVPYEKKATKETVAEIKDYPFYSNPDRGVSDATYRALGFRMKVNEKDGKTVEAAYYPITKKGKLVGWKKRDLTKSKKHSFSIVGEGDATCDLIGAWKLKPGKKIIITEGEEDLAACYEAIKSQIDKNEKWKGKIHPNVVSVTGGAPYAAENIAHNREVVDRYETVVTAFDSDRAGPREYEKGVRKGYEATCEVQLMLGFQRCKYAPFDLKDASDYLQAGKKEDLANILAWGLKDFSPVTIEDGDNMSLDEILTPNERGADIRCLPKVSQIIGGMRFNEATLLLAPPKSGKTSLSKQIAYDIMIDCLGTDKKVGHIFLEEVTKKTRQSYIALDNGISLPKFREDTSILSREKAEASYKKLYSSGVNIILNTKEGKLPPDQVVPHFKYMYAKGVRYIIFDHLSMVMSGSSNVNERKEIDNLLTDIAAFCESHPVHVIVIAHIKRQDYKPKTDDDGEVIYPYWLPVSHTDARGSGAFEQILWNCICLEPEVMDEAGTIGRVRAKVTFCREWGTKGIGDHLKWDESIGKLVNVKGD